MRELVVSVAVVAVLTASAFDFIAVDGPTPAGDGTACDTAAFVKTLPVEGKLVRATWTVSGLGVFRAYVNGVEVGAEDFLKPGFTHVEKRRHAFAYDVTGKDVRAAADALVVAWNPGSSGGWGVADVLTGTSEPYGRLTCDFPHRTGECPLYYNRLPTGRPWKADEFWVTKYIDAPSPGMVSSCGSPSPPHSRNHSSVWMPR